MSAPTDSTGFPTQHDYFKSLIDYDPDMGTFKWKVNRKGGWAVAGCTAGGKDSRGYWRVHIDGKSYSAGRLAVFLTKGEWPTAPVGHRDGNKMNLRWANLTAGRNQKAATRSARYQRELHHLNKTARAHISAHPQLIAEYKESPEKARQLMREMRGYLRAQRAEELGPVANDVDDDGDPLMIVKPGKQVRASRHRTRRTQ